MKRLSQSLALAAAAFVASWDGSCAAADKWVDPTPLAPEASAPLPPPQTPARAAAAEARPAAAPAHAPRPGAPRRAARSEDIARLPPAAGPGPTTRPELSPLVAKASAFIDDYWEKVGGSADRVLPYLGAIYAPVVNYYGKTRSKESILKEKSDFIRRWPIRQTWPAPGPGTPRITCSDTAAECEISGLRDFDAVSPERGARSTGLVRYSYRVRFADGGAQIIAEDSKVVR
jgi:hypothetical protein